MKKKFALLLAAVMLVGVLAACGESDGGGAGGAGGNGDAVKITWWIPVGEDSTYYLSYEDNPAVKYLETLEFNGRKVDLNFSVPVSGKELENFNTLLMTDEYSDLMDMSFSTTYAAELLEDDYIYDLTDYVAEYMPNYSAILEANPDLAPYVYTNIDGERKILSLYSITEGTLGNFMGFLYRRDWVAKYGTHPETGEAFTIGYADPDDKNSYYDDVIFPSGGAEPVYISDWEWMFEIFTVAMEDLGITDGYCYSPYFKGYSEDGTLYNAFGGGNPMWYKDREGNTAFGGDDESMMAYLECLNTWYNNGWVDKEFSSRTSDMAYAINTAGVHTGKVGLWVGRRSETGALMDTGDGFTDGIMTYGARAPINDIYGSEKTQNQTPYSMYQYSRIQSNVVVSKKVSEEDLPTVLAFLDYLYTAEGGALRCFGMNQEQFEATQDENYIKYGLEEGAYYTEAQTDGSIKYVRSEQLLADNNLASAMAGKRMTIGWYAPGFIDALNASYMPTALNAMAEWDYYPNTGTFDKAIRQQFTPEESNSYTKIHANIDTHMASTIPKFISGELDFRGADWDNYVTMLGKYKYAEITAMYQRILDAS